MNECVFCKILAGEIPSTVVYENEHARVILDIHPKAPVHLLVIGKKIVDGRHVVSASDALAQDGAFLAGLFEAAVSAAKKKDLSGYKLVFNVGREGGAVVDHIHLHILGGWNDGIPTINV